MIIAGAKRYSAEMLGREFRYVKHPASWLNAGCWADEPDRPQMSTSDQRVMQAQALKGQMLPQIGGAA